MVNATNGKPNTVPREGVEGIRGKAPFILNPGSGDVSAQLHAPAVLPPGKNSSAC
jgi:hypothetical protein